MKVNSENSVKSAVKTEAQTKTKTPEKNAAGKNESDNEPEMVFVDPEEGNVRIKGNTIETDKLIINEKGIIYKKPPLPPKPSDISPQQISPEQEKQLTQQQRKRLNEIRLRFKQRRQINRQNIPVETPRQP